MDGKTMEIEWMGKHKGNGMNGETQRKLNGWGNTKEIKWMGKHKGN